MAPRKKTDVVQLSKIRMREALRRKLERDAKKEKTTLNAQIVRRLEDAFEDEERVAASYQEVNSDEWNARAAEHYAALESDQAAVAAAFRDSKILDMMTGDSTESGALLRMIGSAVHIEPSWYSSRANKEAFAERVHEWIVNCENYINKPEKGGGDE